MKWFGRKGTGATGRPPLTRAWGSWAGGGMGAGLGDWPQDYAAQVRAAVLANPVGQRCLRLVCEGAGASAILAGADRPDDALAALALVRVDATFYGSGDLCGLIWESEDRWDHPLTAYATSKDYSGCVLSFRWRSGGMKPLDAIHGPTLTIEGRDASGEARSWYVRLWNYAEGTSEDAQVRFDFDALLGGFTLPDEADPVHPRDIDRVFISLVPADYDAGSVIFPAAVESWAEISDLRCDGWGSADRGMHRLRGRAGPVADRTYRVDRDGRAT